MNISLNPSYIIADTATLAGARWLRLEQVQRDESVSLGEAAAAIDALFGIEPCRDGMGNGGEGSELDGEGRPVNTPSEEAAMGILRTRLDISACEPEEYWETWVDVYKSHQVPAQVSLVSETAEIAGSEFRSENKTELVHVSGRSCGLAWPYYSGLRVSGARVSRVDGSTVIFDGDVDGYVTIQYTSCYERVRVRVPLGQEDAAAVIAFWADMAASCELSRPEQDEKAGQEELERICRGTGTDYVFGGPKECWQTVEHYQKCNCSRRRTNTWHDVVPVTCPDNAAPGTQNPRRRSQFDGYVWCPGEEDEINDPKYYEEQCCTPPPWPLPRCRKTYATWHGGAGIAGGAQRYMGLYGASARLVPVMPPDGICGDLVVEYEVKSKHCCDDVEPLKPHPDNPTTISPGSNVILEVVDGKDGPLKWRASAGLYFEDGQNVLFNGARRERVYASHDICPNSVITVDDTCYPVALRLTAPASIAEMEIVQQDAIIAPGGVAILEARGGVPPYRWAASGLIIEWESATQAQLRAPANACGTYTVTATDPCGQIAQAEIRATAGKWVEQPIDDICHLPGRGKKLGITWYWRPTGDVAPIYLPVVAAGGWRAAIYRVVGIATPHQGGAGCTDPGSCADGYAVSGGRCWAGNELLFDEHGDRIAMYDPADDYDKEFVGSAGWPQDEHQRALSWYCKHRYGCWYYGPGPKQTVNEWHAGGDEVVNFWRWVCP